MVQDLRKNLSFALARSKMDSRRCGHVLFYNFYNFLQVVVRVLMIVQPVGKLFKRLEETVEVHLVVVASANHILVDNVVMCFEYMIICESWVLRQSLELRASYKVVALLTG